MLGRLQNASNDRVDNADVKRLELILNRGRRCTNCIVIAIRIILAFRIGNVLMSGLMSTSYLFLHVVNVARHHYPFEYNW